MGKGVFYYAPAFVLYYNVTTKAIKLTDGSIYLEERESCKETHVFVGSFR